MKRTICAVLLASLLYPCLIEAAEKTKPKPTKIEKPKIEQTIISRDVAPNDGSNSWDVEVVTSRIIDRENGVVCYKMYSSSPTAGRTADGGFPSVSISCVSIVGEFE